MKLRKIDRGLLTSQPDLPAPPVLNLHGGATIFVRRKKKSRAWLRPATIVAHGRSSASKGKSELIIVRDELSGHEYLFAKITDRVYQYSGPNAPVRLPDIETWRLQPRTPYESGAWWLKMKTVVELLDCDSVRLKEDIEHQRVPPMKRSPDNPATEGAKT